MWCSIDSCFKPLAFLLTTIVQVTECLCYCNLSDNPNLPLVILCSLSSTSAELLVTGGCWFWHRSVMKTVVCENPKRSTVSPQILKPARLGSKTVPRSSSPRSHYLKCMTCICVTCVCAPSYSIMIGNVRS